MDNSLRKSLLEKFSQILLIDWVKVSHLIWHKIGYFEDIRLS